MNLLCYACGGQIIPGYSTQKDGLYYHYSCLGLVPPNLHRDVTIAITPHFDGETYDPDRDHSRLALQQARVRDAMKDGRPHTLHELSEKTGDPEASVSARIRDLRKAKHGGYTIERKYVERGLFSYRMIIP